MDFNRKKERLLGNKTGHFPKKVDIGELNWSFMVKKVDIEKPNWIFIDKKWTLSSKTGHSNKIV